MKKKSFSHIDESSCSTNNLHHKVYIVEGWRNWGNLAWRMSIFSMDYEDRECILTNKSNIDLMINMFCIHSWRLNIKHTCHSAKNSCCHIFNTYPCWYNLCILILRLDKIRRSHLMLLSCLNTMYSCWYFCKGHSPQCTRST